MNLDLIKFDLTKIDLKDIKTIKVLLIVFIVFIFVLDIVFSLYLTDNIRQMDAQRQKVAVTMKFFKGIISKKDQFITAKLISPDKVDDLLDKIQEIALKNNIKAGIGVYLDSDKDSKKTDSYVEKTFSIKATGTLKNMGTFLTVLRNMPDEILDINSIDLSADPAALSNVMAEIEFVVLTTGDDENQ